MNRTTKKPSVCSLLVACVVAVVWRATHRTPEGDPWDENSVVRA